MDYSQLSDFEINVAVFEAIHNGSPDYKEGENGAMVFISFEGDIVNGDAVEVEVERGSFNLKWSTKTGHRVRVFSSIDFPIRLVVTHHYIRAVLVRCNIQRYSPLLRELHR